ncbi:YibE/F family protein [Gordonia sp. (in: high G+C Gram-positive bacteria)]|uniref:YibE/F family protein n=1 Tax=Gordonia sp. (in: high G+C Gram-positive bacteria) TaxID=84139 RepID=UPI0039E49F5D
MSHRIDEPETGRNVVPSHGHGHHHGADGPVPLGNAARWVVVAILSLAAIAVAVGLAVLWPSSTGQHPIPMQFRSADGGPIRTETATVVAQTRADCQNPLIGQAVDQSVLEVEPVADGPCFATTIRLDSGADQGKVVLLQIPTNRAQSGDGPDQPAIDPRTADQPQPGQPTLHVDNTIRVGILPGVDGQPRYSFYDFARGPAIIVWALLFVLAIVVVAAWKGLRSIIGLVFAFLVLGIFTLPSILAGHSPVAVAVVSAALILFVVLYLAHGVSMRTSAALVGTLVSLVFAGLLSWLAIRTMHIAGLSGDQSMSLQLYQGTISMTGLLLAGFIIGALGVLNDVTITQASATFELAAAGEPSRMATFRAAMRVGRDHIASTVYTLVFAYAGSALPLLLLFSVAAQPFDSLVTTDQVVIELARAFVGGIAIAMSVPLTTAVAAALVTIKPRRA